jgi:hypothetical protein
VRTPRYALLAVLCTVSDMALLAPPAAAQTAAADDKRFQIVECVMPSTARKRGRNFTEIVRGGIQTTSADECENFGGTYVPVTALEDALNLWRPEAEKGSTAAQYRVGSILEQGVRGKVDIPAAVDWYRRAETGGDLRARASLIRLAQDGKWQAPPDELRRLLGQGFSGGTEPARAERDTLREQLAAAQSALAEKEKSLAAVRSSGAGAKAPTGEDAGALSAEIQRLRDINETYRQRMTVVEKVSDRLRVQLAGAPSGKQQSGVALAAVGSELTIEIYDPPVPTTRGVQLTVSPRDGGFRVIGRATSPTGIKSLSVNEKPQTVGVDGSFEIRQAITRGATKFVVKATDGANRNKQTEFELVASETVGAVASTPLNTAKLGTYHALVIGNNAYTRGWPPLQTAVNDARKMAQVLESNYGFKVTLLVDKDRYSLLSAINTLRLNLGENDNLLIYYAGHGMADTETGAAYWVPVDGEPKNQSNWLAASEITNMLRAMKAKNVLIIADACYAGAFTYRTIPTARPELDAGQRATALSAMSSRKSRTILTSGGNEPVLDSSDGKHSLFAAELIPLLEQNKQPLEASRIFTSLAVRVHEAAKKLTKGAVSADYSNQVPYYAALEHAGHEMGDFVLVPK